MNQKIKLILYLGFSLGAIIFGTLFYSSYKQLNKGSASTNYPPTTISSAPTNAATPAPTATAPLGQAATTNLLAATNSLPPTITPSTTKIQPTNVAPAPIPVVDTARPTTTGRSSMIGYLGGFLAMAIGLGLLMARDISEYFGNRTIDFLMSDEGEGFKNPEYDEAEQEWANGNHLEAIRMMRDYLERNPREQNVALRIAEIYEKDLKNDLAAALEYEEVLKPKPKNNLRPERWGWAAIHLCNLYSKMNKTNEAVALLHRIVNDYGETPAAEKARKRLAMFETVGEKALDGDLPEAMQTPPPKVVKTEPEFPASNLPPGFRPKK